jgi:small conductance mechanosensitive channel
MIVPGEGFVGENTILNISSSYLLAESAPKAVAGVIGWLQSVLGGFYNPVVTVAKIIGIILLSLVIVKLGSVVIKKIFNKRKEFKGIASSKKTDTMASLLTSVFRYGVYIIGVVIILTDVLKMTSILAAAGIGGIAVGFGAQSLIKDIISGFFIVFEDQYAVGDLVTIEGMSGTVEELELRVTKLRNFNGDLYIIPNGEIKKVVNHTRGNKAVIVDIPVAYSADMAKAFTAAEKVCLQVAQEFETIVEEPRVIGITELGKDAVNLRIMAKTLPNEQWEVERAVRKLIQQEFKQEGVEFYDRNRLTMEGFGKEKAGNG